MSKESPFKLPETNDFGFTHVDESDLPSTKAIAAARDEVVKTRIEQSNKLEDVMDEIKKFLDNLKLNPEKEFIKWPNRVDAINKFWAKLNNLAN
jgi:hypothetical protein